jgi:hypothetical protein
MQAALEAASLRAEKMLTEGQARIGTHAIALAQQTALAGAVASGDMAALRGMLLPAMQQLRASDPRISVLEVTDARGSGSLPGPSELLR